MIDPLTAWSADVLARARPDLRVGIDDSQQLLHVSSHSFRISWRCRLQQAVHAVRTEDGIAFGNGIASPRPIPLRRLRAALERSERAVRGLDLKADLTTKMMMQLRTEADRRADRVRCPGSLVA